jgi:hypothetical protein
VRLNDNAVGANRLLNCTKSHYQRIKVKQAVKYKAYQSQSHCLFVESNHVESNFFQFNDEQCHNVLKTMNRKRMENFLETY